MRKLESKEQAMLVLKRMTRFNEVIRDTVDNRMISYGEYYYEDVDINTNEFLGTRISAEHLWELKEKDMRDNYDETYYNTMESEKEYRDALKEAAQALREKNVLGAAKLSDFR